MLVGRSAEIDRVCDRLGRAFSGHALVVRIEGEPGVGKSALLTACADEAARAGARVVTARCDELGRARPFGPLLDAVAASGLSAAGHVDRLIARIGRTRSRSAPLEAGPELRSLLVEELVGQFEELALEAPLALCVDDVHWADGATLLTLGALVRRIVDLPFVLAFTARPGPHTPEVAGLLDAIGPRRDRGGERVTRIELMPLDDPDVATLVESMTGARPGPRLNDLLTRCGGNPLLVMEVLASLRDADRLELLTETTETNFEPGDARFPATFGESVRSRMARLEGEIQTIAMLAALLGARFTTRDLAAVTKRSVTDLAPLVSELVAARVVVDDGESLAFRHDLVREAIADAVPASVRAELHRTIADGLRADGAPLPRVAEHVALGATPGAMGAVAVLQETATDIVAQDPMGAASLLRRALELCPTNEPAHDVLLSELVDALAWSGQTVEAQRIAGEVLARPVRPEVEDRLRSALGRSLLLLGRPHDAIPHEERLIALRADRGRSSGWAVGELAMCRLFGLDIDGALLDAERVVEAAIAESDPMAEILGLCVQTFGRNALGDTATAVELGNRAAALADATPGGEGHRLHPNLFRGVALLTYGERAAALASFNRGRQLGELIGASWALPIYHFTTALAHWDAGPWDVCMAEVNAGVSYGEEQSSSIGQVWAHAIAGRVHLHRGELVDSAAALDLGDAVLAASGVQVGADWLALSRALLLEAQARRAEGVELLHFVWTAASDLQSTASLVLVGADLARLALEIGDEELAEQVAGSLAEIARQVPHDRVVGGRERRARGLLHRDPDVLLDAVGLFDALDFPFEAAVTRSEAGELLAATGRADEAASAFDRALVTFDAMGAHLVAEQVRSRLARLRGVRRRRPAPRRAVSGWDSLTPTEWEVVGEVCEGRSNGQAAERLGVSRRTIEAHLRSIYTKLDVSTRLALAVAFREREQ